MQDVLDIIKNVESIYASNTSFQVLKDFERVLDELDIYVYKNWIDGELAEGPKIGRHWVTCSFMWEYENMPDPMGGKRLLDYDCEIRYRKSTLIKPRKIEEPGDMRPGTKKGKLDREPIWVVEIQMPKTLIADIYAGYLRDQYADQADEPSAPAPAQPADDAAEGSEDAALDLEGGVE